jgi:nucleotide-binding universal stress UspA family protein
VRILEGPRPAREDALRGARPTRRAARADAANEIRSLLVPIDLSPSSTRVVRRASLLPLGAGGRINLLHVIPGDLPTRSRRLAFEEARTILAREANRLSKSLPKTSSVGHTVTVGSPAAEIADAAARTKAELIVMGRGAGRPVRDIFLGSTAERVVRQGKLPVLVVRLASRGRYGRPALGLDLDKTADGVITTALRVLGPSPPRLTIVHAYDVPYLGMTYASRSGEEIEGGWQQYRREAVVEIASILARALPGAARSPGGLPAFRTYVRYGAPRSVIKAAVKKMDADLLVLGTHAYAGLSHAFLGTVAGDVLREVSCDVLVVPPRGARPA